MRQVTRQQTCTGFIGKVGKRLSWLSWLSYCAKSACFTVFPQDNLFTEVVLQVVLQLQRTALRASRFARFASAAVASAAARAACALIAAARS